MSHFKTLNSTVNDKLSGEDGFNAENAFTLICADYLQETVEIPDFQISDYYLEKKGGQDLKINGFCLNESEEMLYLFITDYNTDTSEINLNQKNVENLFKQLYRVLNYVIRVNDVDIPQSHILYELNQFFATKKRDQLLQINFYLFTNNKAVNRKEIDPKSILAGNDLNSKIDFTFRIVDLNELERIHKNNQEINIEVSLFYHKPITVLKPHIDNPSYGTAIAIFSGEFLFNIYKEFKGRLLESNVRSFLSANVSVNKGIASTLVNDPGMFLAYNNGLCITVSKIEMNSDGTVKEFKNFQIVNGGQTTSSIYFSKKKNEGIKLERVNVMAKITELKRNIDSAKIQKKIAINSNLQNAVKNSDLTSNEEFLKNLHTCSKKFRNPKSNNYYYFENTRGQYKLERDLSRDVNKFNNLYPIKNFIDKSMLSILFFCAYKKELMPYISVQSAEKRYLILNAKMDEENKFLSENYFIRIAGSYILYQQFDKIYGTGKNAVGKIKKNVIAYSISLIQSDLLKDGNNIDFADIWKKGLPEGSENVIKAYLTYINKLLLDKLNDGRLDEACKKEESWNLILKKADIKQINNVSKWLPVIKYKKDTENTINSDFALLDKHEVLIEEINKKIYTAERYKKLITRVKNEIESNSEDGMSLYNRSHETLLKNHFQPNPGCTEITPKSYKIYLLSCQKADGTIVKNRLSELKIQIEELSRVFDAVLNDPLLTL
ncbi:MAG: AIPR family protein [bacterium]